MGLLTRAQLISQAGLAAGNDQSTTFVNVWLDAWLHRTAKSWAWPLLKYRLENVATVAGTSYVTVGTSTLYIHRIFNPLFYRSSDYSQRGRILISELLNGNPDNDESVSLSSGRLGAPSTCKIRNATSGVPGIFNVYLDPVPDKVYYLALDCQVIPNSLASDASIPWYPSDRTLLQACKCALLELDDGGEGGRGFDQEMMKLSQMVVDDRDFDGEGPGDNVTMGLDKSVFL